MLNIHFNGKRIEVAEGTTLAELLESHRISRRNLFVDGNGDRVNLFSMVGGG